MIIRKLTKEDLHTRVEWMNNPKIYSSMHFDIPILMDKTIEWFDRNQSRNDRVDLTICDSEDNESKIIAFAGIVSIDKTIGKAETYLFVNPDCLGKGYGSKAKALMIDYAFHDLSLNKLYVITNEDNYASNRIQVKFGYKLEGRFRQEYITNDGLLKDRLYWGLLKSDWETFRR